MEAMIERMIGNAADSILSYVRLGWDFQRAVDQVRENSTLGPKAWEAVMSRAVQATPAIL